MIVLRLPLFLLWFIWQVCTCTASVLSDVLTRGSDATPRVVRYRAISVRDTDIFVLSALITLTPGTLTLGVVNAEPGQRYLLVHSMYDPDEESARQGLETMERTWMRARYGRAEVRR